MKGREFILRNCGEVKCKKNFVLVFVKTFEFLRGKVSSVSLFENDEKKKTSLEKKE